MGLFRHPGHPARACGQAEVPRPGDGRDLGHRLPAATPLLVVIGEPSASLAGQIRSLLRDLRGIVSDGARPTLCFDRGGWSLDLFAEVIEAGFDLLIWRQKDAGKDLPDLPGDRFAMSRGPGMTAGPASTIGRHRRAADGPLRRHKARVLNLQQVTCRKPAKGGPRQAHILTTRGRDDLPRRRRRLAYERPVAAGERLPLRARPLRPRQLQDRPRQHDPAGPESRRRRPPPSPLPGRALGHAEARRDAWLTELKDPAPGTTVAITNKTSAGWRSR